MDLGLRGRAAVIAGGTRGVGRATAELLAAEGARVAVLARTPSHLREAEEELLAAGAEDAIGLECDLLDTGEVEAAFTFLDERWGESARRTSAGSTTSPTPPGSTSSTSGCSRWSAPRAPRCRCCARRPSRAS